MPRAPYEISRLLHELVPEPPDESTPARELFDEICLLVEVEPETPQTIEAVLYNWLELEEEMTAREQDGKSKAFAARDDMGHSGTWHRAFSALSPLRNSFGGPSPRASPMPQRKLRTRSMPAIPSSRSLPSLRSMPGDAALRQSVGGIGD
eukprot:7380611-Prymnesium_polylepis.1